MAALDDFVIRQAAPDDGPTVLALHIDSVTGLCGSHYSPEQIEGWFVGRTHDAYARAIDAGALWIAEIGGRPAGFVEVFPGLISMLFVAGDRAGQGVGGRLVDFALARIGPDIPVRLEATLNAQAFYERYGFAKTGDSGMVRPSGLVLPTVSMTRPA